MKTLEIYNQIADIVEYPAGDYKPGISKCNELLHNAPAMSQVANHMKLFKEAVDCSTNADLEELYTQTFDINPVCCLNVGWHLFGENYARGAFLVHIRELLREYGIEERVELPDHLSYVLRLLARVDEQEGDELIRNSVLPALNKMVEGIGNNANPFKHLLLAIQSLLLVHQSRHVGECHHG